MQISRNKFGMTLVWAIAVLSFLPSNTCFAKRVTLGHTGLARTLCKYVPNKKSDWTIECYAPDQKVIARWASFTFTYASQLLLAMLGSIENTPPTSIKSLGFSKAMVWQHTNGQVNVFTTRYANHAGQARVNVLIGVYQQKLAKQYPGIVYKNMGLVTFGDTV